MTPQLKILTEMKAGQGEQGDLFINPFYGASRDQVERSLEDAKRIYAGVFRYFQAAWLTLGKPTPAVSGLEHLVI